MEQQTLKLTTLCGGAAEERFDEALTAVLANIDDVNTPANSKREIVIRVAFSPNKDRDIAGVSMQVETKLAPNVPVETQVMIGRIEGGRLAALENNPKQQALFGDGTARPVAVEAKNVQGA